MNLTETQIKKLKEALHILNIPDTKKIPSVTTRRYWRKAMAYLSLLLERSRGNAS